MKRIVQIITLLIVTGFVDGQVLSKKLEAVVSGLEADNQMRSGLLSLLVVEDKSGAVVFSRNSSTGLPVASSQKVLTSVASLELLGLDYQYRTALTYDGTIQDGTLGGNLYLVGSGDPTTGSWRYQNSKEPVILQSWVNSIKAAGISRINGHLVVKNDGWSSQTIPGGWIWDDIGNYYGAGAAVFNWHENQYDLKLQSWAKTGEKVKIVSVDPPLYGVNLVNELVAGKPGSGDNAYIYLPPYSTMGFVRGTIPPAERAFTVSGSFPDPFDEIQHVFKDEMQKQGIEISSSKENMYNESNKSVTALYTHLSPRLDSINYWFLRKSINLYGEALAKTLGFVKKHDGSTEGGVAVIKTFWKDQGIDSTSINIRDGSGLSPQNRVTTAALVKVMQYAKSRPWFNSFLAALPEFNGIKMKSGTIGGVKSFTGYVNGYTFAIVVNNFNGSTAEIVRKMYRVLDVLK
jgi:D-alanyl-D-alanine carboxypeptidase/D-alanyl-D-alanine-endopeptidase (penicillin-binding protein 4)